MAAKTETVTVKNTAPGDRGLRDAKGNYVNFAPGETRDVEMNEAEFVNASKKSYFDFGDAVAPDPADGEEADDLDLTTAELQALAESEGVKLPETGSGAGGRVVKADIQDAIRAARAGEAPKPADGSLDTMSDTELADTVAVLTGTRPADGTDRETLLQLARGDA
jgi:hypothetical protein